MPVVLAQLVERDDGGVVEASRCLRLAHHPVGIGGPQLLHRNLALQALIEGPIDGSHAPGADALEEPEAVHHKLITHDLHRSPDRPLLLPSGAGFILAAPNPGVRRTVSFLDEDELQPAGRGSGPRGSGSERQRQLMTRRLIALGVGVLTIILLLLAVRGCLNARKERGFENYASDLSSIVVNSNQLSSEFFNRITDPPSDIDEQQLEAQIATDRGSAEALLQRVEDIGTPDELAEAQTELVEAFRLRSDGLGIISENISTALAATPERSAAIDNIVVAMKGFLASDVLYARARGEILEILADEDITTEIPESVFLPEPIDRWLDNIQVVNALNVFASGSGSGIHGLALLSTEVDKTVLTAGAENTVPLGNDPPDIKVQVENQGDSAEEGVTVSYRLTGGAVPLEGEESLDSLDSGGNSEITLGLSDLPEPNTPMTLVVDVLPVPGEVDSSNNSATYTVIFD